jgi:disease resistance protein RPM1
MNTHYDLINIEDTNIDEAHSSLEHVHNHTTIDTPWLVGFDTPKCELLRMINTRGNDGCVGVFCVVGMGGFSKTTLVRKIYESKEDIVKNVSCFAWLQYCNHFLR